jgi:alkylation response protein AidB-like acyl-CoA dehydrogenase
MDFSISPRLQEIVSRVTEFVESELIPLEPDLLGHEFRDLLPQLKEKRAKVKAAGLWAPHLPESIGGMGLSLSEFAHIAEALGRCLVGHYCFNAQAPDVGNTELLHQFGTKAQQEKYLHPLANGDIRSCFAMTEPEFPGSNPVLMGTTAVKEGDQWVIDGHKWFTSSADGAAFTIVMANTAPDHENRYLRASMILVPMDTPGVEIVRNISVMGEPGSDHASHAEVRFTDVWVPLENLLGPEGAGFALAQERLGPGRIHHCMRWIGICERALDLMCRRAVFRQISSREVLADRANIQDWIAESRAEINAARLMVLQAAWMIDNAGQQAARIEISTIKFYVAGVLGRVLDRALQVHGGMGMTDDTPIAYWWRHERAARIYDGPDEVHKMAVARRVLEPYR